MTSCARTDGGRSTDKCQHVGFKCTLSCLLSKVFFLFIFLNKLLLLYVYICKNVSHSVFVFCFFSSWHSAASVSDISFLIHGGYDGNQALTDTHMFNTGTNVTCFNFYLIYSFWLLLLKGLE